jgi:hypothetical protein
MVAVAVSSELLFAVAIVKGEEHAAPGLIEAQADRTVADVIRQVAVVGPAPTQHPAILVPV